MTSWVDAMFYSLAFIQPDDTLDNISRQGMRSRAHVIHVSTTSIGEDSPLHQRIYYLYLTAYT